jgi:probable HAF family extracellular repeat protein
LKEHVQMEEQPQQQRAKAASLPPAMLVLLPMMLVLLVSLGGCDILPSGTVPPAVPPKPLAIRFTVTDLATFKTSPIAESNRPSSTLTAFGLPDKTLKHSSRLPTGVIVRGINRYGQIIGEYTYGSKEAFLWAPFEANGAQGQMIPLNQLFAVPSSITIEPQAINNDGQIAGISTGGMFLWTPTQPNALHGAITFLPWNGEGFISGLNDWGQVVIDASSTNRGALWTPTHPNGTAGNITLIAPVSSDTSMDLGGINSYGQVIGQSYQGSQYSHAFLWTPNTPHGANGTTTVLHGDGGTVAAINDYGQVNGSTINSATFLWTPNHPNGTQGKLTSISSLQGGELDFYDITPAGALVGTSFDDNNHAVVWLPEAPNSPHGKLLALGSIGDDTDSNAVAINASGEVIGFSCSLNHSVSEASCTNQPHLFVWDDAHGMHDLSTLLATTSSFIFDETAVLNDAGQIIVLAHDKQQVGHLLLLTPEPA